MGWWFGSDAHAARAPRAGELPGVERHHLGIGLARQPRAAARRARAGARHRAADRARAGGVRAEVVPLGPAARLRGQRQHPAHLGRRADVDGEGGPVGGDPSAPDRPAQRGGQGVGVVPVPVEPARQRGRDSGPVHQVLEHAHRRAAQQHRHALASVRAAVEPARARDPLQPRVQPEPALPLEVPEHDQDGGVHRAHLARAAHGPEPRWEDP
eukprot:7974593-Pyramimonas_sp.AAC.2